MTDPNEITLEIKKGATESYEIQILDENKSPIDITGWTIYFTCKTNITDADDDAVISIDVTTHTDPANGKTTIPFTSDDTNIEVGQYIFGISAKSNLGLIYPDFLKGNLVIQIITTQRMLS